MASEQRNNEHTGPQPDNDDDYILTEVASVEGAQYRKLPYETPHPDFPAAMLIGQGRSEENGNKVKAMRVYATRPVSRDRYDAAVAHQTKSSASRVLTRSLLLPRDGYAPLDNQTPDSMIATALCTEECAVAAEPPNDALRLRVTRIFEDQGTRS